MASFNGRYKMGCSRCNLPAYTYIGGYTITPTPLRRYSFTPTLHQLYTFTPNSICYLLSDACPVSITFTPGNKNKAQNRCKEKPEKLGGVNYTTA